MALLRHHVFDPRIPFTRAEARAAGITVSELIGPRFHKLFYDVYVSSAVRATTQLRAEAALRLAGPDAWISHHTAAQLWGLPIDPDGHTHLSVLDQADRLRRQGVKSHLGQVAAQRRLFRGLMVTTPTQTFLDLAAIGLPLVELVVLGDAMLRRELITRDGLAKAIDDWPGNGTRLARRAAGYLRLGVDSPMESRLRMLLVLAGLPEPDVNLIIYAENGDWELRFDLWYPEFGLLVEYDGRHHSEDTTQWERDIFRREDLDRRGLRLVVVISRGIYGDPERTLIRVRDALRDRGAKVRRNFKNDWRRHFPSA